MIQRHAPCGLEINDNISIAFVGYMCCMYVVYNYVLFYGFCCLIGQCTLSLDVSNIHINMYRLCGQSHTYARTYYICTYFMYLNTTIYVCSISPVNINYVMRAS